MLLCAHVLRYCFRLPRAHTGAPCMLRDTWHDCFYKYTCTYLRLRLDTCITDCYMYIDVDIPEQAPGWFPNGWYAFQLPMHTQCLQLPYRSPIACVYCYSIQVPVTLAMHVMVFQYLLFVWTVLCTLYNNIYVCSRSFWYIPLPLAVIHVHVCVISFYILRVHVHLYMYVHVCIWAIVYVA